LKGELAVFTFQGISVDSYVMFGEECRVACQVNGPEIEIEFGHSAGSLHLVTSETGLAKLVDIVTETLALLRALPDGAPADFRVPAPIR
jgi:hypothetical protein